MDGRGAVGMKVMEGGLGDDVGWPERRWWRELRSRGSSGGSRDCGG